MLPGVPSLDDIDRSRSLLRADRARPAARSDPGTLDAIIAAHATAIPFENLDVLLERRIDLEPAAIEQKLVVERRGGYCFEQNTLLLHVLEQLGFAVRPYSARVRLGRPRDYTPARTHLFCAVELDGRRWLADVGAATPGRAITSGSSSCSNERAEVQPPGRWLSSTPRIGSNIDGPAVMADSRTIRVSEAARVAGYNAPRARSSLR
jgi:arylamine N-acetyltransferase